MSNLSKPGVNATGETFSAAATLRKAVAPVVTPLHPWERKHLLEALLWSLVTPALPCK